MSDDYVAWCRYTGTSIVTCDSDGDNAFRVYRRADDPDTIAKFNQMSDCLDDIRVILDGDTAYASRMNRLAAIRNRINFCLPDTPVSTQIGQLTLQVQALAAENAKLREALEDALPTMNCKMFETLHAKFEKALARDALKEKE